MYVTCAEVKVGDSVKVDPSEFEACIHLSQAALGEAKKDKASEPVVLYLKVGDQKFVLGTLSRDKIPQISLEIVLDKEFELSHNSKTASVHFCGYKAYYAVLWLCLSFFLNFWCVSAGTSEEDDFTDSDEDIPLVNAENGKPETKAQALKVPGSKKPDAKSGASAKQVKVDVGKKRPNDSASKTPVSTKKAKNATPEKTDGKKSGHTATPHPMKKGGKTPNSESKDQTPKSAGQISCKSCSKTFNSEAGFQQHNKAKHGGQ
ncbi:Zinc finger C2H2-type [Sesbania bispinosa]|nr:Zinc finger C2H2-type [Sesbania bispinosa]